MNKFENFRRFEKEAFRVAAINCEDSYDYPPDPPLHTETVKMILAAEHSLKEMWKEHGKILIPASQNKGLERDCKGIYEEPPYQGFNGPRKSPLLLSENYKTK